MNKNGFTLIELLIVISIFGILAAIAIPAFRGDTSTLDVSYGINGRTEIRCIGGFQHSIDVNGTSQQIIGQFGGGVPCENNAR